MTSIQAAKSYERPRNEALSSKTSAGAPPVDSAKVASLLEGTPGPAPDPRRALEGRAHSQRTEEASRQRVDAAMGDRCPSQPVVRRALRSLTTSNDAVRSDQAAQLREQRVEAAFAATEKRALALLTEQAPAPTTTTPDKKPAREQLFPAVSRDIFTGFRQGGTGNCVSVAAIKAGMTAFGPDRVFQSIDRRGEGVDVRMRDGKQVHVSIAELNQAAAVSRFSGTDAGLVQRATLMYAAMAKRAQQEGNDGMRSPSFQQAMATLNNGENVREGAHWLGLDASVRPIGAQDLNRYPAVVMASSAHAVFSSHGVQDMYGRPVRGRWLGTGYAIMGDAPKPR